MKIGIILYSQTGHTRQVCEVLQKKLTDQGHSVKVDEISVQGPTNQGANQITLLNDPDASQYEGIVLAGQVQAFSLSGVMKAYLPHLEKLKDKKTALLLTKHFKSNWTGGNGALGRMKKAVLSAGGEVVAQGIVHWSSPKREGEIETVCQKIATAF